MARAVRLRTAAPAWVALALALAGGALAVRAVGLSDTRLDWQPALAAVEPWRAFSAAWVHYGDRHLAANLGGTLLVAALGAAARVPPRLALAWLAAWPLTQLGLLVEPALHHYGGLSGVLHAGVAVVVLHLVRRGETPARRGVGLALGAGLAAKLWLEAPWAARPVAHPLGWDIATVPLAHASGVLAGLLTAMLVLSLPAHSEPASSAPAP